MTPHHFIVDASEIIDEPGAAFDVDGEFDLGELVVGDESFPLRAPASTAVSLANAGSGLVASGSVTADVTATCARCLIQFPLTIVGEVQEFFLPEGAPGDDDAGSERITAEGTVDLGPALIAALVMEAPFAPLHDPDCAGLCASCGADLNEAPCSCSDEAPADHPFAGLAGMFGDSEDDA